MFSRIEKKTSYAFDFNRNKKKMCGSLSTTFAKNKCFFQSLIFDYGKKKKKLHCLGTYKVLYFSSRAETYFGDVHTEETVIVAASLNSVVLKSYLTMYTYT